jgi:hypothetical protein
VATNGVDSFIGNLGAIAGMKPDVLDKFDSDKWADEYSEMLGINPELIVPSEQVAMIRKQRADQAAMAQRSEMLNQSADTANKLAGASTNGQNALTDVMGMFSGYNSPSPQSL